MAAKRITIGPSSEKQRMFLSSKSDITIYGGGAGSGKTYCALMKGLEGIHDPKYRATYIRQTRTQLLMPGGIVDMAKDMYRPFKPKFLSQKLKFIFPSGAEISFGVFDSKEDKKNFDSSQFTMVCFDEAQWQFMENVVYIMSRLRSESTIRSQLILTCNPLCDSYLHKWVEEHLDIDTGIPIPEKDGMKRYFVNDGNAVKFYHDKDLMLANHTYLKADQLLEVTYISAVVYDNPIGIQKNPQYLTFLQGLPRLEKQRLLYGSWTAREEASGFFKRDWVNMLVSAPTEACKRVRAWDLAGTLKSEANTDPDWSVGVLMARDRYGHYYIEDVQRFRERHHGVLQRILDTAKMDGYHVDVVIPADPNAAGKAYASTLIRELAEQGFYARSFATNQSKVLRFAPFASLAEGNNVSVVRAQWNDEYFQELEIFDGGRKHHDDQVDATSDAFKHLARSAQVLGNFSLPDMKRDNPMRLN